MELKEILDQRRLDRQVFADKTYQDLRIASGVADRNLNAAGQTFVDTTDDNIEGDIQDALLELVDDNRESYRGKTSDQRERFTTNIGKLYKGETPEADEAFNSLLRAALEYDLANDAEIVYADSKMFGGDGSGRPQ